MDQLRISLLIVFMLLCSHSMIAEASEKQPHIILFIADDLGWGDISFHNSRVITPQLDTFLEEGLFLNYSYVQTACSPSRHAFMTGRYPFRDGMQRMPLQDVRPHCMPLDLPTLPEKLRDLGYSTNLVGKWHLGKCHEDCLPLNRGYDTHYGFLGGRVDHLEYTRMGMFDFWDNGASVDPETIKDKYASEVLTDRAIHLLDTRDKDQPQFLVFSLDVPHDPPQAPKRLTDLYSYVEYEKRRSYLGMVSMMDEAIANVTNKLKLENMWDDSIVIFFSDNGAQMKYGGSNYPLQGAKFTLFEGGTRSPTIVTGGRIKRRGVSNDLFHVTDLFTTLISLAGGEVVQGDGLDLIDGVDQSKMFLEGDQGLRKEFVYNLETHAFFDVPVTGHAAIRYGDYKLIWGYQGGGDIGHPDPWPIPHEWCPQTCSAESACDEDTVRRCTPLESDGSYAETLRKNTPIVEQHTLDKSTQLFNIKDDPIEKYNLSPQMPEMVALLQDKLLEYMKDEALPLAPNPSPKFVQLKQKSEVLPIGWCSREYLELWRKVSRASRVLPRHLCAGC